MNVAHGKRKLQFLKTLSVGDVILIRRFARDQFNFSFASLVHKLSGTTLKEERNQLGSELVTQLIKQPSIYQLLVRSMVRWVIRNHNTDNHSKKASLLIISGGPASGKSSAATGTSSAAAGTSSADAGTSVIYDSDADKLRILYLLNMIPENASASESQLVELLAASASGLPIHFLGDFLQPLQRAIRSEIFQILSELCYHITIIGLHTNVAALQRTADAFKQHDTTVHVFDIYKKPEEQARRLRNRAATGLHFAVLPFEYARQAAVDIHRMIKHPSLRQFATQRNAEVILTSVGSFNAGKSKTSTKTLIRRRSLDTLPPLKHGRSRSNTL
jgi:hypothetical protein